MKFKGFTSYGVDADALDLEAFWQRELSVELGLHNLVVANIPTLCLQEHSNNSVHLKRSKTWTEPWLMFSGSYLRGSFNPLKFWTATLVCPPLTKVLQTVLVDRQSTNSNVKTLYFVYLFPEQINFFKRLNIMIYFALAVLYTMYTVHSIYSIQCIVYILHRIYST